MFPHHRGRVGRGPERVTAILDFEVELGNISYRSGGNLDQDTEGGTASMANEGYPTKSDYFDFYSGGLFIINWGKLHEDSDPKSSIL